MAGLVEAFNALPGGGSMPADAQFDAQAIAGYIGKHHLGSLTESGNPGGDAERRIRAKQRVDLYEDRGHAHFDKMLRSVFKDPKVLEDRLAMLPLARFQNVTRRIAQELAMVYQAPAKRSVKSGNEQYQAFIRATGLDTELREAQRYTTFANDVYIGICTRPCEGKMTPVLDVVTPEAFSAVPHPLYKTDLVAVVLDMGKAAINPQQTDPRYVVWSEDLRIYLDGARRYLSHEANPYGVIPGVLVHRKKPRHCLLDADSGQDIIDAHLAVCLLNVMMLFGQKTGTKAPYAVGDMSRTARGQSLDQDKLTQFEEGVAPGVLDLGHDPDSLIASAKSTIAQVAANYGIPEDVFNLSHSATSGYDRRMKRWGLEERREEQVPLWREYERELAEKAAIVMDIDGATEYQFRAEGWQIDFGEVATPQEPMALLTWREKARSLGLRTAHDDISEDNPDLDEAGVDAKFMANIALRAHEVELMRALNMPSDPTKPGASPQENGAMGGRPAADESDDEESEEAAYQ